MRKLRIDLANRENDGIISKRNAPVGNRIKMAISMIKKDRYSHRSMRTPLTKVWNQHLTLKQLEYHKPKQNKRSACRIIRNKHMIEISSEVFVVGPTRARSYSTIMYKAVHMTYEASPSRHSQGLFKTLRDHFKTNRGKADH